MAAIAVIEDDRDHRQVIAAAIRRNGHRIAATAEDGESGLKAIAALRPDLVIADVDMPVLDGLQMCRFMRADPALADIPVVLVTAFLLPGDPRLVDAGAAAVVRKPFSIEKLIDAVETQLAARPQPLEGTTAEPTSAAGATDHDLFGSGFTEALLDSLDVGVAVCDTRGRHVLFNQSLRDIFGDDSGALNVEEFMEHFQLLHHDRSPLRVDELPIRRALAGEQVRHGDLLAYDRRQCPRWLDINARPLYDAAGSIIGALAAVHEVTAEHRARSYQKCKTDLLGVLAANPDTHTAAAAMVRVIGTSLGWPFVRLWLIDDVAGLLRPAASYASAGQPPPEPDILHRGEGMAGQCWQHEEMIWAPDIRAPDSCLLPDVTAGDHCVAAGSVPVRNGDRIVGVLSYFTHDRQEPDAALTVLLTGITGNIGAYLERRRAEELAHQLAATTDEYIALVGHELRTPLTSIAAYTDLLTDTPADTPFDEVRDQVDAIARNTTRLQNLVEHLLDLAAFEVGHNTLNHTTVDLTAVLTDAVQAVEACARHRHVTITTDVSHQLLVAGDPDRLRQVADHLITNAIKYSPEHATVTISASADQHITQFTVSDHGIGIPAEEHHRLFRRFYRASNARHTDIPGAGLGLALSRAIIERHRGSITLTPNRPTGTSATVRLPRPHRPTVSAHGLAANRTCSSMPPPA